MQLASTPPRRLTAPPQLIKACRCGQTYTVATWRALPYVGILVVDADERLELRNCSCGSTLALEVPR